MGLFDWLFPSKPAPRPKPPQDFSGGGTKKVQFKDRSQALPGELVLEIEGKTVCIPPGISITVGSSPESDMVVRGCDVAPRHARIDNKVARRGYESSHPFCTQAWIADIGGASVGEAIFGPRSRTGVLSDNDIMPLEHGETAPLRAGQVIQLGSFEFRVVSLG